MKIGVKQIGPGEPVYIIAEIGVNHDGEVDKALMLTDAAASAGADAIKLQYFETDLLMSKAAKLAAYQRAAGEDDPIKMLRRLELSLDEMARVVGRAHERGIHAIVTVFSTELVEPAMALPWDAVKSASPDIIHRPLLEALTATGRPMIVSSGASTLEEVKRAVGWLEDARERLAVLQCVSCYPCPLASANVGAMHSLRNVTRRPPTFDEVAPIGYSDHTAGTITGWLATHYGASLIEKHITLDPNSQGPDHAASLGPSQFAEYVELTRLRNHAEPFRDFYMDELDVECDMSVGGEMYARLIEVMSRYDHQSLFARSFSPEFYESVWELEYAFDTGLYGAVFPYRKQIFEWESDVRYASRQSIVVKRLCETGVVLNSDDLTIKRPGTGIEPFMLGEVIGRRLARDVEGDAPLTWEDLEPGGAAG